ncbi:hypothetical protein JCM9743_36940 [Natrinema sp. JCM 9743]
MIRCRNSDGLLWYYASENDESDEVVLYHEWNEFEPEPRSGLSARVVMNHPDISADTVARSELEEDRGEINGE